MAIFYAVFIYFIHVKGILFRNLDMHYCFLINVRYNLNAKIIIHLIQFETEYSKQIMLQSRKKLNKKHTSRYCMLSTYVIMRNNGTLSVYSD
jgi:hypothetical protein